MLKRRRAWVTGPLLSVMLMMPAAAGVAVVGTAAGVVVSTVSATAAFADASYWEIELQYQSRGYGYYSPDNNNPADYCWYEVYDVFRVLYLVTYDSNWNEISRQFMGMNYWGVDTIPVWCG